MFNFLECIVLLPNLYIYYANKIILFNLGEQTVAFRRFTSMFHMPVNILLLLYGCVISRTVIGQFQASRLGHKRKEKNSVHNLPYGPRTQLIRGCIHLNLKVLIIVI